MKIKFVKSGKYTFVRSENYNYDFNQETGHFKRWGKTEKDDPEFAPFPEIADLEITTICRGPANKICRQCYKGNSPKGYNMPLTDFKNMIDKMPWLQQIALGADAQAESNPDMFDMMHYARSKGIIPNLTVADVSEETAKKLADVCGAVAVSVYTHVPFDVAFDSVKRLADAGQAQINLHYLVDSNTINRTDELINAIQNDPRLTKLNAVVFLGLKQKGRGTRFQPASADEFKTLVHRCIDNGISFGFDSCSAPAFIKAVKGHKNFEKYEMSAESCEATLFSSYVNEKGIFYPCSFGENVRGWEEGINVLEAEDFIKDVWNHHKVEEFRQILINNKDCNGCRNCPIYAVQGIDKVHDSFKLIDVVNV